MTFQHYPQAQSKFEIPLRLGNNVYLGDVLSNHETNPGNPFSAGFFKQTKGEPLKDFVYKSDEMKIILEGEVIVTDAEGNKVTGKPGDVFFFPKGKPFTFDTPDYVLAFLVIQRPPLDALKK
ncbi:hypothetical protein CBS63078_5613 [Aspergillus niger]|uniref:(S)-ureidoglycine aminohydrolase cupin domain-containing protein n=2 Tax=Aspergillus niger TaxID=5061 RepID=G3YB61_ASPNA|nr:hypothetical protein ASPNIDRAFT_39347 [Aspergillus niger ATCC 1015]KAI2904399.1 hypothetical protein CBS63078_5613 [Aspergillus niger]KAI2996622.1 hypothetical protein CBS147345_9562 [Aspergillus niger]KAI3026370.1 hypothetical protein CBS147347_5027 [Aspergillus niger]TPR04905.1 hypothetical protein CAN33_0032070 [Aspergillus niger]